MLSSEDWAYLNGDRAKWQAVDNTVRNCRVILNSGDSSLLEELFVAKKKTSRHTVN